MKHHSHSFFLIIFGVFSLALPFSAWAIGDGTIVMPIPLEHSLPMLPKAWDELNASRLKAKEKNQPESAEEMRKAKVIATVYAAHELIGQNKNQEALAKLHELDLAAEKTEEESFLIERTLVAIASHIHDEVLLLKSAEAVVATGCAPADEQIEFENLLARSYYNQKKYPQAILWLTRYFKEGGTDADLRVALVKSYYFNHEYARAASEANANIESEESAGKLPSEELLKVRFNAASNLNDQAESASTLEKLATAYPKKEYWSDLVNRIVSKPGFSDSLSFDTYRFMYATGQINTANDYVEMAKVALRVGEAAEARHVLDQGYAAGILGQGSDAASHRRLHESAVKSAAAEARKMDKEAAAAIHGKSGDKMVELGYRYINHGAFEKGIKLMERGILADALKQPNEAKLHLGIGYLLASRKEDAVQTLKSISGTDGTGDLARYWVMYLGTCSESPRTGPCSPA